MSRKDREGSFPSSRARINSQHIRFSEIQERVCNRIVLIGKPLIFACVPMGTPRTPGLFTIKISITHTYLTGMVSVNEHSIGRTHSLRICGGQLLRWVICSKHKTVASHLQ
jgi:hypothetical protein